MRFPSLVPALFLSSGSKTFSAAVESPCSAEAIPRPNVYGTDINSVNATPVLNFSFPVTQGYSLPVNVTNLNFCNVTIQYTHPGYNDSINVQVWLPLRNWNSRFFGTGGGGWKGHLAPAGLVYPMSQGYATVATDTGHDPSLLTPSPWALTSPGNINWPLLQNFAATALDEAATIGKAVTTGFYKSPIKYSYFMGCSEGGRMGLQLAQRYPTQYNGIIAFAPPVNLPSLSIGFFYPLLTMKELGIYPPTCEFEALTLAATEACDDLDGVIDNTIGAPELCTFDPTTLVNTTRTCPSTNTTVRISSAAATIAATAWSGPRTIDGKFLGYGLGKDTSLRYIVNTTGACGGACHPEPWASGSAWIPQYLKRNLSFNVYEIERREYDSLFRQSRAQFDSIIGTNDPDLTDFRDTGGKMIMSHGTQDDVIPPENTLHYYKEVLKLDPDAAPLCPWPLVRGYKGGDVNKAASYECRKEY